MIGMFKRVLRKYLNYGSPGLGGITKLWKSKTKTTSDGKHFPSTMEYQGNLYGNISFTRVRSFPESFLIRVNGIEAGYLYFYNKWIILDLYKKPPIKLGKSDENFFKGPVERNQYMLRAIEIIEEG